MSALRTRSSAIAERPRDALGQLKVLSFAAQLFQKSRIGNGTVREVYITSY